MTREGITEKAAFVLTVGYEGKSHFRQRQQEYKSPEVGIRPIFFVEKQGEQSLGGSGSDNR